MDTEEQGFTNLFFRRRIPIQPDSCQNSEGWNRRAYDEPRISSKSRKGSGPGNGELIRDERQAQSPLLSANKHQRQKLTGFVLLSLALVDVGFRIPAHIRNSSKPSPRVWHRFPNLVSPRPSLFLPAPLPCICIGRRGDGGGGGGGEGLISLYKPELCRSQSANRRDIRIDIQFGGEASAKLAGSNCFCADRLRPNSRVYPEENCLMIDFERNLGGGEGGSVLPSAACSHPFPFFSLFSKKKRGVVFFSSSFWDGVFQSRMG